ncbi:MAG: AzlC family ABC transporter permease [Eubacterium sp.]
MNKNTIEKAFKDSLPVMTGYIFLGMGFGVMLQDKGYSVLWALLMSTTIYAGAMQYVAVDLLSSGASLIATALMTIMINARHFFYGIAMLDKYEGMGKVKPYLVFALTDETFSIVCNDSSVKGVSKKHYYFLLSIFNQSYWIIGGAIGAILGSALAFDSTGIDFAMTALFVVIFVEQWTVDKQHIPALIGVIVSLVCLILFGSDKFVIPAMIAITFVLCIFRSNLEREEKVNE